MEPQQNEVESVITPLKKVTPLSKYLAMLLFIILPFVGGWIGYVNAPEKVVEVEKNVTTVEEALEPIGNQNIEDMSTSTQIGEYVSKYNYVSKHFLRPLSIKETDFTLSECPGLNVFEENVRVGDMIGDMKVKSVESLSAGNPIGPKNLRVTFSGPISVVGIPTWEEIGSAHFVLDVESAKKLPCFATEVLPNYGEGAQAVSLFDFKHFDDSLSFRLTATDPYLVTVDEFEIRIFVSPNDERTVVQNRSINVIGAELLTKF